MTIINTTQAGPDGDESALLEYRLYTTPYPIRVSPSGAEEGGELDPARAQLVFVASNNGRDPVRLRKLTVEIPTGELAAQLALSLERVESTISLTGWTASRSGERIEFTTTDPYTEIAPGQGLTFQISEIPVNHEVGAVELRITEGYEGTGRGSLSIFTGKFPQDFYLDGFSADTYEIDNGGKVVLTWKRSEGVTTTLLYGGNPPEDVTKDERKVIEDVRTTTTFYLIGQVGDVQIMRSVLVTVLKPDMVVSNLTVEGALKAEGGAVVYDDFRVTQGEDGVYDRILHADKDTVDVRGLLRLLLSDVYENSGRLEVSGGAEVTEDLTVKGGATVHDDFRVVKGDKDEKKNRALWIDGDSVDVRGLLRLLESSAFANSGKLEVAGGAEIGGELTVKDEATVEKGLTAKKGAVVYDDFRVTQGSDGKADRMLWVDGTNAQFRVETQVLGSGYKNSGKLTVAGKSVICYGHEVRIYNEDKSSHLNSTKRHKKCTEDWSGKGKANAYWRSNSYDGGSNLKIEKKP